MSAIPEKVALILPRLATEHVGELVATRDALLRSLRAHGLDLHDLARACTAPSLGKQPSPPVRHAATPGRAPCFGDLTRACRDLDCGQLSPRERTFVADMVSRGYTFTPTPRQASWLDAIYDRLRPRAAA